MRRRATAVSTVAAAVLAATATHGPAAAADDDDGDKNTLLAEAQFQLFLVTANYEPTDITCTPPPSRDDDGQLLCYALISERVSVAAIATMDSPGVYSFLPLNKVDPADLEEDVTAGQPAAPVPAPDPTAPGTPTEPGSGEQNAADTAVLASIDAALAPDSELTR